LQNEPFTLPIQYFQILAISDFLEILTPYVAPDPWYITGFYEGDGGCSATVRKTRIIHTLQFVASQKEILLMIQNYFGGKGKIYQVSLPPLKNQKPSKPHWRLLINKNQDLVEISENHFQNFPLYASKGVHYEVFMEVVEDVSQQKHIVEPGHRRVLFNKIVNVNLNGKRRMVKDFDDL